MRKKKHSVEISSIQDNKLYPQIYLIELLMKIIKSINEDEDFTKYESIIIGALKYSTNIRKYIENNNIKALLKLPPEKSKNIHKNNNVRIDNCKLLCDYISNFALHLFALKNEYDTAKDINNFMFDFNSEIVDLDLYSIKKAKIDRLSRILNYSDLNKTKTMCMSFYNRYPDLVKCGISWHAYNRIFKEKCPDLCSDTQIPTYLNPIDIVPMVDIHLKGKASNRFLGYCLTKAIKIHNDSNSNWGRIIIDEISSKNQDLIIDTSEEELKETHVFNILTASWFRFKNLNKQFINDEICLENNLQLEKSPCFIKQGKMWKINFKNSEIYIKDYTGNYYIAELLKYPNKYISVEELSKINNNDNVKLYSNKHKQIDAKTYTNYNKRLNELINERDTKDYKFDEKYKEKVENEINNLIKESKDIKSTFNSNQKKVSNTVSTAINRAKKNIMKECSIIGEHFDYYIDTGCNPIYRPPENLIWDISTT